MKLNVGAAFAGTLVGMGGTVPLWYFLGIGWISLAIAAGAVLLFYILAATTVSAATGFSEFMRGMLIGFNGGANGFIALTLVLLFAPLVVAIPVAAFLALLALLCSISGLSQGEGYQGLIGWLNWFMPMSWLIIALGFVFFFFSLLLAIFTGFKVDYLKLRKGKVDWATGTFFVKGGLVANLNAWDTAFNMGNFAFVDMKSSGFHTKHEAGHTLNLAAFGSFFHLYGAFDEIVIRHARAYAERLAESNSTGSSGSNIPMWK